MLRLKTDTGWWLVTHQEHARRAGRFAEHWGNDLFARPEPREPVLFAIAAHDDGWAERDAQPQITRSGVPAGFSVELVGKYSAFEEIDLLDYIAVRDRAVSAVVEQNSYAGLLVSMHTYNLLTERADRSSIAPVDLPLLDKFLERQRALQQTLRLRLEDGIDGAERGRAQMRIEDNFRVLQAMDNLSLLACVDYAAPATLLHPLRHASGGGSQVRVDPLGRRCFRLTPWPFPQRRLELSIPARHVEGTTFASPEALHAAFDAAPVSYPEVVLTA